MGWGIFNSNSNNRSGDNPIMGALGLVVVGLSVWALVCAVGISYGGITLLLGDSIPGLGANIALGGIAGLVAGFSMLKGQNWWVTERRASAAASQPTPVSQPAAYKPVTGSQPTATKASLPRIALGKCLVGALIGLLVGAFCALFGCVSFLQDLFGTTADVFTVQQYPVVAFLGGGFGGPAPPPTFWSLLFLFVVLVAIAVLWGLLCGFVVHLLLYGFAGSTAGGLRGYVRSIISDDDRPISTGLERGAFVGLGVGILQGIFTVIGANQYYHPTTASRYDMKHSESSFVCNQAAPMAVLGRPDLTPNSGEAQQAPRRPYVVPGNSLVGHSRV
jgi:hypothetical protein